MDVSLGRQGRGKERTPLSIMSMPMREQRADSLATAPRVPFRGGSSSLRRWYWVGWAVVRVRRERRVAMLRVPGVLCQNLVGCVEGWDKDLRIVAW